MRSRTALRALAVAALALQTAPVRAQGAATDPGAGAAGGAASGGTPAAEATAAAGPVMPEEPPGVRPPPLHVEYAQYGVAITAEINIDDGAVCRDEQPGGGFVPCILGSGGGLLIRGGYRSPGPWYFGGAYGVTKMDSSNLYRLGVFQQLRAEMRYLPDIGYRAAPYFTAAVGGVAYGNEWGAETGGALISLGAGVELEISRLAVLGLGAGWRPVLLAGWTDTAGHRRRTAIAQFFGIELLLEVRTELGRR